jgi:hypothetical protein
MLAGETIGTFNKAALAAHAHSHAKNFTFTAPHHGLPSFDQFSDLDSDEDFVNGLVNFSTTSCSTSNAATNNVVRGRRRGTPVYVDW